MAGYGREADISGALAQHTLPGAAARLRVAKDRREIARRGHRSSLQKPLQHNIHPEMPNWLLSRFELALAAVLLAAFSAARVEVLLRKLPPF